MNVFSNIDDLPAFRNAVITIGTFDGLHNGHRKIIGRMRQIAAECEGTTVLITFYPHPRQILQKPDNRIYILNTLEEKIKLLELEGIDNLVVVPFTNEFSEMSAEAYISDFLVKSFHPHTIIIGYDHHFGKNRTGNFSLLKAGESSHGYRVLEIPEQLLNDNAISSTKIRKEITNGEMTAANLLLGYTYFFSGEVVKGDKLGRTIGFPTANLLVSQEDKLIPGNGVYAVDVLHDNLSYKGMMNIGTRPTVNGSDRRIEVHVFHFNKDIYGQKLIVSVKTKIREEIKFESLEALRQQLMADKETAIDS